jgi:hypothetical protein
MDVSTARSLVALERGGQVDEAALAAQRHTELHCVDLGADGDDRHSRHVTLRP